MPSRPKLYARMVPGGKPKIQRRDMDDLPSQPLSNSPDTNATLGGEVGNSNNPTQVSPSMRRSDRLAKLKRVDYSL
ncbi:hypothetical protein VNI00_015656 [Paramarasmius palmivorus]|uniref:Uncharacterized protein n=1 Tax=Paramarasmius palmivorus TaxID=297713 RepID=A0AAW0BKJ2_9AGAR